jgi:hypothetical protein
VRWNEIPAHNPVPEAGGVTGAVPFNEACTLAIVEASAPNVVNKFNIDCIWSGVNAAEAPAGTITATNANPRTIDKILVFILIFVFVCFVNFYLFFYFSSVDLI